MGVRRADPTPIWPAPAMEPPAPNPPVTWAELPVLDPLATVPENTKGRWSAAAEALEVLVAVDAPKWTPEPTVTEAELEPTAETATEVDDVAASAAAAEPSSARAAAAAIRDFIMVPVPI